MDREQIIAQLKNLIEENLEIKLPNVLKESDQIYEDLNIDSIMVLQLIVYVEENFGVSVPEEDVDPAVFQTIGSLVTFIQEIDEKQEATR